MLGLVTQLVRQVKDETALSKYQEYFIMSLELTPFDFETEMERSNSVI
jgi:hypothetical protein